MYGTPSPRPFEPRVPVYPSDCITRRVLGDGAVTVDNDRICVGRALIGRRIGLRHEGGLRWRAYFFEIDLGILEIAGHDLIAQQLVELGDLAPESEDETDGSAADQPVNQSVE